MGKIRKNRSFVLLGLIAVFAVSCATLKPGDIPDRSAWLEPEEPRIRPAVDVFQLRLDLERTVANEDPTFIVNKDGTYKTITDIVPDHYLGVDIGNGLFVDFNGNLCVDVIRLAGLDARPSFRLKRISKGNADGAAEYIKEEGAITIVEDDAGRRKVEAAVEEGKALVSTSRFFQPKEIFWNEKEVRLHPAGFLSEFRKSHIRAQGAKIIFSNGYGVEKSAQGTVMLNNYRVVTKDGDKILYKIGNRVLMTMVRSKDRAVFYRTDKQGFYVDLLPGRIAIYSDGGTTEYSLTER